jgi:CheY-like chemotaxis protein
MWSNNPFSMSISSPGPYTLESVKVFHRRKPKLSSDRFDLQAIKMKKVLVVDDDIDCLKLVTETLNNVGFQTRIAFEGKNAIQKLTTDCFDFILLDWNLPDMKGDKILEEAQRILTNSSVHQPRFKTPVVTYTSYREAFSYNPNLTNFTLKDRWNKSMPFSELVQKANQLLQWR